MARQTLNLGTSWPFTGNLLIAPALVDGGGTAYLRRFGNSGALRFLDLTSVVDGAFNVRGPDFTAAIEVNPSAFTLSEAGGDSITIGGPRAPGNLIGDASEPYSWYPPNAATDGLGAWVSSLSGGVITLVIDDGLSTVHQLRATLVLPAPSISPRLSRVPATVHKLRASLSLAPPSILAPRVSRGVAPRKLRATLVLPAPSISPRLSRVPATVHKLRASLSLAPPSIPVPRVSRVPPTVRKLRANVVLPAPVVTPRLSRVPATVHKLRANVVLPAPGLSARVRLRRFGFHYLRATLVLPVPLLSARVSKLAEGQAAPLLPPAPVPRPVSPYSVLVYMRRAVGGLAPTSFDLRWRAGGSTFWQLRADVGLGPFPFTGLTPNRVYEFSVRARNAFGSSLWSDPESARTAPVFDVTRHADLLISQYGSSVRLVKLLENILSVFQEELVDPLLLLSDLALLDLAEGVWLDHIGVRLGFNRPLRLRSDLVYFSFGPGANRASFDGGGFRPLMPEADLANLVPVGDEWYRSLLRGRALALRLGDSVPDLEAICAAVFEGGGRVLEGLLSLEIHVSDSRPGFAQLASSSGVVPSPAGIAVSYVIE